MWIPRDHRLPTSSKKIERSKYMNKKSFVPGFLLGMLVSLVVMLGAFIWLNDGLPKKQPESSAPSYVGDGSLLSEESIAKIEKLAAIIDQRFLFEYDEEQLTDMICSGILYGLEDPYTAYYDAESFQSFMEQTEGNYCGVGVQVQMNHDYGYMQVSKVFPNSGAAESGMLPNDMVMSANGTDLLGMDLTEAVSYVKGEEGTSVELTIYRPSTEETLTITCERRIVEIPTVEHEMLAGNIGYILLAEFDEVTTSQFFSAMEDLRNQGMKGLIVDVRDNPGGLLSTVVEILQKMLPEGKIVYTEDVNGEGEIYFSDGKNEFDLPLVVLTNGYSASASEIFAAALQDYEVAQIVGTNTYGKGIVQSLIPLGDGTAAKLTVSRYFTPKGVCIHETGVAPDVEVELEEELQSMVVIPKDQDNQLEAAMEVINNWQE